MRHLPGTHRERFRAYLDTLNPREFEQYAKACGTTAAYLHQLKGGHRLGSPALAKRLVEHSDGQLTLADVRPDVWGSEAKGSSAPAAIGISA